MHRAHQHRPPVTRRPELSQHFLREGIARQIVRSLALPPATPVIEPGAGAGALTAALADAACRVIAVERDVRLHRRLRSRFIGRTNVEAHHADILTFPLPREPYVVVSNVPYAITAALVRRLLAATPPPDDAWLIVQREAADRFTGLPRENRISLTHKPWFGIEVMADVARDAFIPPPSVASVLLHIHRRETPLVAVRLRPDYHAFVTAAFGSRRQRARDALRMFFSEPQLVRIMREHRIPRDARPSEIPFAAWLALFRFHAAGRLARDPADREVAAELELRETVRVRQARVEPMGRTH